MSRPLKPPIPRQIAWFASISWMALIFAISSIPGSSVPSSGGTFGHFAGYAVLGGLLFVALLHHETVPGRALARAVLLASAYAVTDEFHQHFVPGRTPDAFDWGVDTLGALFGAAATLVALRTLARLTLRGEEA